MILLVQMNLQIRKLLLVLLTRSTDADTGAELVSAYTITGSEGSVNASEGYVQATPAAITVGTTALVWNLFNSSAYSEGTGIRIASNIIYSKLSEGVTGGQDAIGGTGANDTFTLKGSSSTADRTSTAPAFLVRSMGPIAGSTGAQVFHSTAVTVNQTGDAGYTAMKVAVTESAVGSSGGKFLDFLGGASGTSSKFSIANTGTITIASGSNLFAPGINTLGDANYTLVIGDNQRLLRANFTTLRTITIPPNSSVPFPTEAQVNICQYGAGQVSIVAGVGVTIRSKSGNLKPNGQYVVVSLIQMTTDDWLLIGDLTA